MIIAYNAFSRWIVALHGGGGQYADLTPLKILGAAQPNHRDRESG